MEKCSEIVGVLYSQISVISGFLIKQQIQKFKIQGDNGYELEQRL